MAREELSDRRWEQLRPLLPPQKPRTGRPNNDHRTVLSGMLWILRTGAPWRDLPPRFGAWATVASRFYRWRKAGIWPRILERLQQQSDQAGVLDWSLHFVDGTVVRAPPLAACCAWPRPHADARAPRCHPRSAGSSPAGPRARPAGVGAPECAARSPPCASGRTGSPPSPTRRSGAADRARGRRCAGSTACRSAPCDDRCWGVPSVASEAGAGDATAPSVYR